jgi:transposase
MERRHGSTKIGGIDVGKRRLDVAVHGQAGELQIENGACGFSELIAWLKAREVGRVGLEASGGYERGVRAALEAAGFEVVLHQPIEVRLFARLKRKRAKNDRLDAHLIAAATAQVDTVRAAQDPRLGELAQRLTAYEQITDQAAELKTFLESVSLEDLDDMIRAQIRSLEQLKARLAEEVVRRIKAEPDLLARFQLLLSVPGVGKITAASLVVRMPELGQMDRGQAAALAGVAPYDRDSGQLKGRRAIAGGRVRVRNKLYLAADAARRADPGFRAFAQRLLAAGKPKMVVRVALMRKLVEATNLVLARGQPWVRKPAT